jgi:hypothetical protein
MVVYFFTFGVYSGLSFLYYNLRVAQQSLGDYHNASLLSQIVVTNRGEKR